MLPVNSHLPGREREVSFLFRCLRTLIHSGNPEESLRSVDLSAFDWPWPIETGRIHRILPFVVFVLKNAGKLHTVPLDIQTQMASSLMQSEWENVVKGIQFQEINRVFERNLIPIVSLKGIALTQMVYFETPFRQMGDIDLLIQPEDFRVSSPSFSVG